MDQKVLLITPPFTQLNTPYPATAYLKGFLNTQNISCDQVDLGIDVILRIFSQSGLTEMFDRVEGLESSQKGYRLYSLRDRYIDTIDAVIDFLQDKDSTLSHLICERQFLPEGSRFEQIEELEWAFGAMGVRDKARHLATLYLEDLGDFITEYVDPHFGFSRYAERISVSASSFDKLYKELIAEDSFVSQILLHEVQKVIVSTNPDLVCLTVPFPGNLFCALKCGQFLKENFPKIKIAMGGGYPNTELRSVSDTRVFEFVDFISLDDGETPMMHLLEHLNGTRDLEMLKRTFSLVDGKVVYHNGAIAPDVKQANVGIPDYEGLPLKEYISVIQFPNPMHRLWSDGRWNKLTMAHGCYWGKCTFCDISLDYIKNYEASSAELIVDRMETLIEQTGESGFHFVDEAAPPSLMKSVAIEILKRKLIVSWWTNIRFEKSFTQDLCRLLAASGCIAVSGGLEVASDRLLKLIDKGVTIEQVARVNKHFVDAGIMVHAYLMYGFPTQTEQETIDSLEVVRQMFEEGVMQSGFWHRFAMTAHSPVGLSPEDFKVEIVNDKIGSFANNDLEHQDPKGCQHELFSEGLKKSLYNYMHGIGLDWNLQEWFDHQVPETTHSPNLITRILQRETPQISKEHHRVIWIGGQIDLIPAETLEYKYIWIHNQKESKKIQLKDVEADWLFNIIKLSKPTLDTFSFKNAETKYFDSGMKDFGLFWYGPIMSQIKELGLLVV